MTHNWQVRRIEPRKKNSAVAFLSMTTAHDLSPMSAQSAVDIQSSDDEVCAQDPGSGVAIYYGSQSGMNETVLLIACICRNC